MKAVIINNFPCCSQCSGNPVLGNGTGECSLITHNGQNYVKFQRFCNGSCREKYEYFAKITMDKITRYSLDEFDEVND